MRGIAALAEAACLQVSPDNPAGPLATLASAHFADNLHDFVHLEYAWDEVAVPCVAARSGRANRAEAAGATARPRLRSAAISGVVAEHGFAV